MNTDPIYEADGKISVRKAVPFGLQHVLAMFVANIAPILIVTGVVKVPASEAGAVVQAAMIIAGIGSLLQMYPFFRLGSGLPVIMGISFTFVSVFCVIGLKYGYGAILGAVLIGGVLEGILGLGAAWWRKLVPPIVSATVVTAIGFSLLPIGANSFGGGFGHPEFGDARFLIVGTVTLVSCLIFNIRAKSFYKQLSVLFGLFVGYVTAYFYGMVDLSRLTEVSFVSLPVFMPYFPGVCHRNAGRHLGACRYGVQSGGERQGNIRLHCRGRVCFCRVFSLRVFADYIFQPECGAYRHDTCGEQESHRQRRRHHGSGRTYSRAGGHFGVTA